LHEPEKPKISSSSSSDKEAPVYEAPEVTLDQKVEVLPEPEKPEVHSSSSSDKEVPVYEAPEVTLD
jgi:hypothetical protein